MRDAWLTRTLITFSACRLNDVSLEHFTESMERPSLLEFNISNCDQRDERRRKTFPEAAKRKARINNHVRIGQSSEFIDILIVNLSSFVTQATGRWDTKCNGPRNAVQNAFTKNLLRYIAGIGASRRDNANWAEERFHYETAHHFDGMLAKKKMSKSTVDVTGCLPWNLVKKFPENSRISQIFLLFFKILHVRLENCLKQL